MKNTLSNSDVVNALDPWAPNSSPPRLSKSRIQSGRQCHKRLWLELHQSDASSWTAAAQVRLDEGTQFGELAQELLGGGVLIAANHFQVNEALAQTAELLQLPYSQAPMLFEAAFSHEGVRVRVDGFQRHADHDTLIEVKSTTAVKAEHIWDCAIQTWVARGSGRNVSIVMLGHIDNQFVYQTLRNYQGLLKLVDITLEVEALLPRIAGIVAEMQQVALGPVPEITTGAHCFKPYGCPFYAHCRAAEPEVASAEFPIELLPRIGASLLERLRLAGYSDLRDVPDTALERAMHLRVSLATRTGTAFVADQLGEELDAIAYPRHYLDFETIRFVVPRWFGTRPFQQLPFQFSCHIQTPDGALRHEAFLDLSGESPMLKFVEHLLTVIGVSGPVLVWNIAFEATRLRELARMFPQHAQALHSIVKRMVDLLPIYRAHYYHRDMRGSWSIKAVLPTIAPELAYDNLTVSGGDEVQTVYRQAISVETSDNERAVLRQNLLDYCERDTLAMVRLGNWRGWLEKYYQA